MSLPPSPHLFSLCFWQYPLHQNHCVPFFSQSANTYGWELQSFQISCLPSLHYSQWFMNSWLISLRGSWRFPFVKMTPTCQSLPCHYSLSEMLPCGSIQGSFIQTKLFWYSRRIPAPQALCQAQLWQALEWMEKLPFIQSHYRLCQIYFFLVFFPLAWLQPDS